MGLLQSRLTIVAAVILGLASQTQALTTDNLEHLATTNGSLTIGDKTFSNFDFLANGLTDFDASQIRVTASIANGVYYLTYAGNISLVSGGPATADLLLNYRVTAATGLINMIDQLYTGSAQPIGGSFLAIDETVRDLNGNLVANSHLDGNDLSDPSPEPGDNLNINPGLGTIDVTKDIAFGSVNGGFISISEVRQSFHQVPEPGTMAMLILGLGILGMVIYQKLGLKLTLEKMTKKSQPRWKCPNQADGKQKRVSRRVHHLVRPMAVPVIYVAKISPSI
jgi:hypothetical protein